jgi:cytochrome c biogenesis protein CcmG/thiol:disulfide interchange protein DsbE
VNRFVWPLLAFALLVVVLAVGVARSPEKSKLQSALIGRPAPAFSLPDLLPNAKRVVSQDFAGRAYALNVWGTWCVECRAEHDVLMQAAREAQLPIVGLNWKDDDAAAREWLERLGNPYQAVAVDNDGRVAIDFGVYGAPETFLIDSSGRVAYRHVGALTNAIWQREFVARAGLPRR